MNIRKGFQVAFLWMVIFVVFVSVRTFSSIMKSLKAKQVPTELYHTKKSTNAAENEWTTENKIRIFYFNPPKFVLTYRRNVMQLGFDTCTFNNCYLTYRRKSFINQKDLKRSNAIIFDGRTIPKNFKFDRPFGQVWIFASHECPLQYGDHGQWWNKDGYNWTMTYDKTNSDIFLPYGEIVQRKDMDKRDFLSIAKSKSKTALMVSSHCITNSRREEYVAILKRYIDVDVLGACGKTWNCGQRLAHDDQCFKILNTTYKFYLAFENALCRQYFTEKFFENFNYDAIMITRAGLKGEAKSIFPEGTFISTDDFKSPAELGKYLRQLSTDDYAKLLERKCQFYSLRYETMYQRALCEICKRMNNLEKFTQFINNTKKWAFGSTPCREREDIDDLYQ